MIRQRPQRHGGGFVHHALVQPGQADDVLNQRKQAAAFLQDTPAHLARVLSAGHARGQKLRVAADGGQRGAQFMAHVGSELPAAFLRLAGVGHVLQEDHHAALGHRADGHMQPAALPGQFALAGARLQKADQFAGAVHLQNALAHRVILHPQHVPGGGVHGQHRALFIQQDQSFPHAAQDDIQLAALAAQTVQLLLNAPVLLIHPPQHG